jgi:hypothetical protein
VGSKAAIFLGLSAVALLCGSSALAQSDASDSLIQDVTVEEVKRFIDPTEMIDSFDYSFAANFLPFSTELYTNRFVPFWAVNRWTGFWAEMPIQTFALADSEGTTGAGDVLLGWGAILHENLESRFTTSIVTFEALAPTGDPDKGTGVGTWVLAPGGALAINPTDKFPIYVVGRYLHSLENLGGDNRREAGPPRSFVGTDLPDRSYLAQGLFRVRDPKFRVQLQSTLQYLLPRDRGGTSAQP